MSTRNSRDSDRESQRPYKPPPPQHMDPSKPPRNEEFKISNKVDIESKPRKYSEVAKEKKSQAKKLGESDSEITDETTI